MKRATVDLTDAEYRYLLEAAMNVSRHELRRCGISELIRFLIEQDMKVRGLFGSDALYSLKWNLEVSSSPKPEGLSLHVPEGKKG
jgi:O-phosphoseryl-tRNA(Cys) synthetase